MESVWWVFRQLHDKGLVYRGFKVMPYSTQCNTPLSNFEANLNYKEVDDPAVVVSFPLADDPEVALLAWTTTPWTLPSNLALCVNPELVYVRIRDLKTGGAYIVAESRLVQLYPRMAKKGYKGGEFEVLDKMPGKALEGRRYVPLFDYFRHMEGSAFRVLTDGYVTDDSGTGVVHCAPAFGEDDYRVCMAHGVVTKGGELPCPVDANGRFTAQVPDYAGKYVKDADHDIMARLKAERRLVQRATLKHSYPFCWRSETPLIYRAVPSWFVRVESIKERLLEANAETYWVPDFVKAKRFHNWLRDARDWAISRNRYWCVSAAGDSAGHRPPLVPGPCRPPPAPLPGFAPVPAPPAPCARARLEWAWAVHVGRARVRVQGSAVTGDGAGAGPGARVSQTPPLRTLPPPPRPSPPAP